MSDAGDLLKYWKDTRTHDGKALLTLEPKVSVLAYRLGNKREPVGESGQACRSSVLKLAPLFNGERFEMPDHPDLAFTVFTDGQKAYLEYLGEREWEDLKRFAQAWSGRAVEDDETAGVFVVVECVRED